MRFGRALRLVALVATAGTLTGCEAVSGTGSSSGASAVYDPAIRTEIDQSLAQSAARASNALETLAMIQRARTVPAAPAIDDSGLPPELKRSSTVAFSGPAVELVRELAQNIGYKFVETGVHPANPGLVSVDAHDVPVSKVLEDVGLQSQSFATVIVDPNQRRVEFRNERGPGMLASAQAGHGGSGGEGRAHHAAKPKKPRHYVKVAPASACVPCTIASRAPAPAPAPAPVASPAAPPPPAAPALAAPAAVVPAPSAPAPSAPAPAAPSAPAVPDALPPGMVPVGPAGQ